MVKAVEGAVYRSLVNGQRCKVIKIYPVTSPYCTQDYVDVENLDATPTQQKVTSTSVKNFEHLLFERINNDGL